MRIWLKTILPIALAAAAWGSPTACVSGTYASYQALGSGGCTVGDETFSNFGDFSFTNTLNVDTIDTSNLVITPSVIGGVDELVFTYQDLPTTSGGFPTSTDVGVAGGQTFSYNFSYTITPSPNPIVDIQMLSTILNTNGASVSAVKDFNSDSNASSANDNGTEHPTLTSVSGPVVSVASTTGPYTVLDTISLEGQNGIAEQQDFTNEFTEGPFSSTVPEPSSMLLIASGLICFGVTKKFRVNR
jgi:hypothetical protein